MMSSAMLKFSTNEPSIRFSSRCGRQVGRAGEWRAGAEKRNKQPPESRIAAVDSRSCEGQRPARLCQESADPAAVGTVRSGGGRVQPRVIRTLSDSSRMSAWGQRIRLSVGSRHGAGSSSHLGKLASIGALSAFTALDVLQSQNRVRGSARVRWRGTVERDLGWPIEDNYKSHEPDMASHIDREKDTV